MFAPAAAAAEYGAAYEVIPAGAYTFNWAENAYDFTQQGTKDMLNLFVEMQNAGGLFPGVHTLTDDDARQQYSREGEQQQEADQPAVALFRSGLGIGAAGPAHEPVLLSGRSQSVKRPVKRAAKRGWQYEGRRL